MSDGWWRQPAASANQRNAGAGRAVRNLDEVVGLSLDFRILPGQSNRLFVQLIYCKWRDFCD